MRVIENAVKKTEKVFAFSVFLLQRTIDSRLYFCIARSTVLDYGIYLAFQAVYVLCDSRMYYVCFPDILLSFPPAADPCPVY